MTTEEIELVRNTWISILAHKEEAGDIFYNTLFELSPEIRSLFNTDIKSQNQKLVSSVTLIVTKLNTLDNIRQEVKFLAKRHVNYQVKPYYFAAFGKAFITMLAHILGDVWTPAIANAWSKVFKLISDAMIEELEGGNEPNTIK